MPLAEKNDAQFINPKPVTKMVGATFLVQIIFKVKDYTISKYMHSALNLFQNVLVYLEFILCKLMRFQNLGDSFR